MRSQRPNPKNPDFPSTGVTRNQEHPLLERLVRDGRLVPKKYPLGFIQGEPLSETIIRERR